MSNTKRYELKFVLSHHDKDVVMAWLRGSIGLFKQSFAARRVNNIYFDHANLSSFNDNIAGISRRQKMRYRWYGDAILPVQGVMEMKDKDNNLGSKRHIPINHLHVQPHSTWRDIITQMTAQSNTLKLFTSQYHVPVLCNRYLRQYYESYDKKVRITIDSDLTFYQQHSLITPNFTKASYTDKMIIVECKFDEEARPFAQRIMDSIPVRRSRYSKYAYGAFCNH